MHASEHLFRSVIYARQAVAERSLIVLQNAICIEKQSTGVFEANALNNYFNETPMTNTLGMFVHLQSTSGPLAMAVSNYHSQRGHTK